MSDLLLKHDENLTTADISQRYAAPPKLNTLGGAAPRALTPACQ